MATLWKNVFVEVPLDNDIVWIVRLPFFDTPIQAKFSEGPPGSFTWADSNPARAGSAFRSAASLQARRAVVPPSPSG